MEKIKTDSLGIEILNKVLNEEGIDSIKLFKTEEEAILSNKTKEVIILFELYENDKIINYFILSKKLYVKLTKDYKLEGVEI